MENTMKDRENERLRIQLEQAKPPKRRKVVQDPNERFISLAQVLAQSNQQPKQRVQKAQQKATSEGGSSSESEEEPAFTRRSIRARRPTRRYMERDSTDDESVSES